MQGGCGHGRIAHQRFDSVGGLPRGGHVAHFEQMPTPCRERKNAKDRLAELLAQTAEFLVVPGVESSLEPTAFGLLEGHRHRP
jgi:hypothetical protein